MILRRPYKFLIKYFKPIHILMFIIFIYYAFAIRKINVFFNNYVQSGNFIYVENMVNDYVPWYAFLLIILVIVGTIFIYLLMKRKDKPVLYYRILILYSIILFGVLIYFYVFFSNTKDLTYEPLRIVINRDISTFIYIINYFYVGFSFIRGFGFDIKKFNFEQDKKEFEIEETDNEEFEVNVEIDRKDVDAKIRTRKREFGYIVKEHAKSLIITGVIVLVLAFGYIYVNFFVINKIYKADETVIIGNLSYKVNEVYLTNLDKYGSVLNQNYCIVNLNAKNNSGDLRLSREKFRLKINDKYYYPGYNNYTLFDDMGSYYDNDVVIKASSNNELLLIFNVGNNKSDIVYLEILKNVNERKYDIVKLNPVMDKETIYNYSLNDEIKISGITLSVKEFGLLNKDSFEYQECNNDVCNTYTKTIVPGLNQMVLKLNINNSKELSDAFFGNSVGIKYDEKVLYGSEVKMLGRNEDIFYFNVPRSVQDASYLSIVINTRDGNYNVMLRG